MSVLPILAGVYVSQAHDSSVPLVLFFSLALSLLGYWIMRQMMMPISGMSISARQMAQGQWDQSPPEAPNTADEVQELTQSLKMISKNARELLEKVENLSLNDKLTGLYNAHYIRGRLDEEIQRAIYYQQPCSFAYFVMRNYDAYVSENGEKNAEEALKEAVRVLSGSLGELDRAAHIGRGELAIILPDKNKKKSIETMKSLSAKILKCGKLSPCIGISENPIDGVQAAGLYAKAQERAKTAKQKGDFLQAFD